MVTGSKKDRIKNHNIGHKEFKFLVLTGKMTSHLNLNLRVILYVCVYKQSDLKLQ